jgi:hypothetical protein
MGTESEESGEEWNSDLTLDPRIRPHARLALLLQLARDTD